MRDALLAGLTLDIFQRHADKVAMANVAQLVNCLQSLFLATRIVSSRHRHSTSSRCMRRTLAGRPCDRSARRRGSSYDRVNGKGSLWGLAGSASLKNRTLTLTVVNPHVTARSRDRNPGSRRSGNRGVRATTLAASRHPRPQHVRRPDTVRPRETVPAPATTDGGLTFRFPPASVTRLTIEF